MTVDLTNEELEALHYFVAVIGVQHVPPSLRPAALSGHAKLERACNAAEEVGELLDPGSPAARSR